MLSKYSVAFYTISILLGLLFTKHRTIFLNKHFWYASLIGFIIFLPNLIWQWQNHFPVIVHMNELQQTQLQYINPSGFLIDQLLFMLPCCFCLAYRIIQYSFIKTISFHWIGLCVCNYFVIDWSWKKLLFCRCLSTIVCIWCNSA